MTGTVVYLAAQFPKLSETFVYREVLGLRARGLTVPVAAVRPSEDAMGEEALEALKGETLPVYGAGAGALLKDALLELLAHPLRAAGTLARGKVDAFTAKDAGGMLNRMKIVLQAFASLALARRLRPLRPALLHAHMGHVPATFAMYTARQLGIPFSFTGHAADIFRDRALLDLKLRRAAFVHCISLWHRGFYQSLVSRPDADYPLVRCGVDLSDFADRTEGGGAVRLLAVGRLVPKKGFDLLLEALAAPGLAERDWTLTLVGDGPERAALERQRSAHPARGRITLAGSQPNTAVRARMSETDLFLLPCRVDAQGDRDGIPVVLMEAMAAGAAVISGDIPSIRELIESGKNGILVPPGDVAELTKALILLCTSASLRASLSAEATQTVEQEFSLQMNLDRIIMNLEHRKLCAP